MPAAVTNKSPRGGKAGKATATATASASAVSATGSPAAAPKSKEKKKASAAGDASATADAPSSNGKAVSKTTPSSSSSSKKKRSGKSDTAASANAAASAVNLPSSPIAQGVTSSLPVLFTKDADYFCVAASSSVKIHSRTTGAVVSTLSAPDTSLSATEARNRAHIAPITGLILHPNNPLQLITASLDGTIKIWDYLDAVLLKSIDVGYPITHLAAHAAIKSSLFVAVRKPKANPAAGQPKPDPFTFSGRANSIIYSVSLAVLGSKSGVTSSGVTSRKPRDLLRLGKTRDASGLQVSPDGQWLLAIGNRKVQIAQIASLRQGFTKFVSDERLVSLAFHPTEPIFATGDATGKIRIWHCLDKTYIAQSQEGGVEKHAPSTLLHWHSHAVSSLAFTPNGAYLLSGGEEAVLVLWQLASQAKEFVPRLGAPISSIAVADGMDGREQEFVLGLADGTTTFVGALNLKPTRSFARVKTDPSRLLLPPSRLATLPAPLAVEPLTGHVVLNGSHPSSLQFFDTLNDTLVSELEVAPSNRTSRPEDAPLEPTRIERVAFSSQRASNHTSGPAEWMATIDSRHGGSLSSELALKFWRYSASAARYVLNTRIDNPHEQGVTSIAFSNDDDDADALLLVSTGLDKKIKTWKIASHTARGGRLETYWVARSVFGYRETVPSAAAWSPDGSLLAVAQAGFVTLWEPVTNSLITALSCPELKMSTLLSFTGRAGRYIVVGNSKTIVCWDLVTSAVKWHKVYEQQEDGSVEKVLDLPERNTLAILRKSVRSRGTKPVTFIDEIDPASANVVKTYKVPYGVREAVNVVGVAGAAATASASSSSPRLIAVSDSFDVFEVGPSAADVALTSAAAASGSSTRAGETAQSLRALGIKRRTLFDDLFGSVDGQETAAEVAGISTSATQQRTKPSRDIFSILDGPAHLLPPMQVLFDDVLRGVLPKRREDEGEGEGQQQSGIDGEKAGDVESDADADVDMDEADADDVDDDDARVNDAALVRRSEANRAREDDATMDFLSDLFTKQLSQQGKQSQTKTQTPSKKTSPAKATSGGASAASSPKKTPTPRRASGSKR